MWTFSVGFFRKFVKKCGVFKSSGILGNGFVITSFLSSFDRKIIPNIGNEEKKRKRWCATSTTSRSYIFRGVIL